MDSQERHELQQNELEEFLTHFGDFWARWGNTLLTGLLVIIVAVTVWRFWTVSQQNAMEEAWYDLATAANQPAAVYQQVAESHSNDAVRTLAYLRGGDAALAEAAGIESLTAPPTPDTDEVAEPDAAASIELAGGLYRQALESSPSLVFRLNALLGLGAVAEAQQQWDAAREHYNQVVELAGAGFESLADRAQVRLNLLDNLARPVVFAPEREAATPPAQTPLTPVTPDAPDAPEAPEAPAATEATEAPEPAPVDATPAE